MKAKLICRQCIENLKNSGYYCIIENKTANICDKHPDQNLWCTKISDDINEILGELVMNKLIKSGNDYPGKKLILSLNNKINI